jgi:hypothetical protein
MKKNVRSIPARVITKIESLQGRDIVAGCAEQFSAEDIRNGVLAHLGVELRHDGLHLPERIVPPASRGKYSARNVEGHEVVLKDLPKQKQYHVAETPNWGDSYYGTHTVLLPHQAYPRDFYPPRELEIILHCHDTNATLSNFLIAARVDEVLNQEDPNFDNYLLENLNLLQENLGACSVVAADSSFEEYARTLRLSWEILPPGSREEAIERLFQGRTPTQQQQSNAEERYDFFGSLKPKKLIVGSSGFRRYFGAMLEDDLVVFENIGYGNAVYVMYENWEQLAQQSRLQLLSGRLGDQFDRVIHRPGWQKLVQHFVSEKRKRKQASQRRK